MTKVSDTVYASPAPDEDVAAAEPTPRYEFDVTNVEEVLRCFLMVDSEAIYRAIANGLRASPGLRIYEVK